MYLMRAAIHRILPDELFNFEQWVIENWKRRVFGSPRLPGCILSRNEYGFTEHSAESGQK